MGNVASSASSLCGCIYDLPLLHTVKENKEHQERLDFLAEGDEFSRTKYTFGFGTGTEKIRFSLADDAKSFTWKITDGSKSGTISFLAIEVVKANGAKGFQILGKRSEVLIELDASSEDVRNKWVETISAVVSKYVKTPEDMAEQSGGQSLKQKMEESAHKQKYWIQRQAEMKMRELEAQERRNKFAGAGMKYTALAMSSRGKSDTE